MAWTFVIAAYLGLYHFYVQNTEQVPVHVPGWFTIYHVIADHAPIGLLPAVMVYCRRFKIWKWLPIVWLVYVSGSFVNYGIRGAMYNALFNIGAPNAWVIDTPRLVEPTAVVLSTLVVFWVFDKLGYEFERGARIGATKVRSYERAF